ncbi:unnamed protein product, partial [Prorocentrum cordatum]
PERSDAEEGTEEEEEEEDPPRFGTDEPPLRKGQRGSPQPPLRPSSEKTAPPRSGAARARPRALQRGSLQPPPERSDAEEGTEEEEEEEEDPPRFGTDEPPPRKGQRGSSQSPLGPSSEKTAPPRSGAARARPRALQRGSLQPPPERSDAEGTDDEDAPRFGADEPRQRKGQRGSSPQPPLRPSSKTADLPRSGAARQQLQAVQRGSLQQPPEPSDVEEEGTDDSDDEDPLRFGTDEPPMRKGQRGSPQPPLRPSSEKTAPPRSGAARARPRALQRGSLQPPPEPSDVEEGTDEDPLGFGSDEPRRPEGQRGPPPPQRFARDEPRQRAGRRESLQPPSEPPSEEGSDGDAELPWPAAARGACPGAEELHRWARQRGSHWSPAEQAAPTASSPELERAIAVRRAWRCQGQPRSSADLRRRLFTSPSLESLARDLRLRREFADQGAQAPRAASPRGGSPGGEMRALAALREAERARQCQGLQHELAQEGAELELAELLEHQRRAHAFELEAERLQRQREVGALKDALELERQRQLEASRDLERSRDSEWESRRRDQFYRTELAIERAKVSEEKARARVLEQLLLAAGGSAPGQTRPPPQGPGRAWARELPEASRTTTAASRRTAAG